MNAKKQYQKLMELRSETQELTEKLVLTRLANLHGVGRAVLEKVYPGGAWREEEMSFLGKELDHWLKHEQTQLLQLSSTAITLFHPKYGATRQLSDQLKLPKEFLHMSDRDFASHIRTKLRARKLYLEKLRRRNAKPALHEAQRKLEEAQKEVKALELILQEESIP